MIRLKKLLTENLSEQKSNLQAEPITTTLDLEKLMIKFQIYDLRGSKGGNLIGGGNLSHDAWQKDKYEIVGNTIHFKIMQSMKVDYDRTLAILMHNTDKKFDGWDGGAGSYDEENIISINSVKMLSTPNDPSKLSDIKITHGHFEIINIPLEALTSGNSEQKNRIPLKSKETNPTTDVINKALGTTTLLIKATMNGNGETFKLSLDLSKLYLEYTEDQYYDQYGQPYYHGPNDPRRPKLHALDRKKVD